MSSVGFSLYLATCLFSEENLLLFLKRCHEKGIGITKYGYYEPLKNKINPEDSIESTSLQIAKFYDYYTSFILKGKNKFWLSLSSKPNGITTCGGALALNKKTTVHDLAYCLESFAANNQLLFGSIYTDEEHDEKHKKIKGSSVSWPGISIWDFEMFLPGIYSYTLFGEPLMNALGRETLLNLDHIQYRPSLENAIGFLVNDANLSMDINKLMEIEKKVADQIGSNYFYQKNTDTKDISHSPLFLDYLKNLKTDHETYLVRIRHENQ